MLRFLAFPTVRSMPRGPRFSPAGVIAHVIARGNGRAKIFHEPRDFDAFIELCRQGIRRAPLELMGWCLMPNHIHLVVRPGGDDALGRFMHWVLTTHGQRFRAKRATVGHIWQGRYKSSLIQVDRHFVTVLRYVERNPVRAAIVPQSIDWEWSSARERVGRAPVSGLLAESPLELPTPWSRWVDEPLTAADLDRVRACVTSGRALGQSGWVESMAAQHGMESKKKKGTVPLKIGT